MQIVINISKKLYDRYKKKDHIKRCDIDEFEKALDRCIILPKGHGDLIDINEITAFRELECNGYDVENLDEFTVIIEADKED